MSRSRIFRTGLALSLVTCTVIFMACSIPFQPGQMISPCGGNAMQSGHSTPHRATVPGRSSPWNENGRKILDSLHAPTYSPMGLSVSFSGFGQVILTWDSYPADPRYAPVIGFNIYRGTSPGSEIYLTTAGNVTTYTDSGLVNGQMYYYTITAINEAGESPRSNEIGRMAGFSSLGVLTVVFALLGWILVNWCSASAHRVTVAIKAIKQEKKKSRSLSRFVTVPSVLAFFLGWFSIAPSGDPLMFTILNCINVVLYAGMLVGGLGEDMAAVARFLPQAAWPEGRAGPIARKRLHVSTAIVIAVLVAMPVAWLVVVPWLGTLLLIVGGIGAGMLASWGQVERNKSKKNQLPGEMLDESLILTILEGKKSRAAQQLKRARTMADNYVLILAAGAGGLLLVSFSAMFIFQYVTGSIIPGWYLAIVFLYTIPLGSGINLAMLSRFKPLGITAMNETLASMARQRMVLVSGFCTVVFLIAMAVTLVFLPFIGVYLLLVALIDIGTMYLLGLAGSRKGKEKTVPREEPGPAEIASTAISCAICGRLVTIPTKCSICGRTMCRHCKIGEFCPEDFQKIPADLQAKILALDSARHNKSLWCFLTVAIFFCLAVTAALAIPISIYAGVLLPVAIIFLCVMTLLFFGPREKANRASRVQVYAALRTLFPEIELPIYLYPSCPKCHMVIKDGGIYCPRCGAEIKT